MEFQDTPLSSVDDQLLTVLADPKRRAVLDHLRESSGEPTGVDELASTLRDRGDDEAAARVVLHHSTLPALAATDAVEYDADRRVARYRGHETLEALLDGIEELDPAES